MNINVNVPEQLYKKAVEVAHSQHISVDEVLVSALEAHLSAWKRLQERVLRGNRDAFLNVLAKVPDIEPEENDRP